eukprot:g2076.t1
MGRLPDYYEHGNYGDGREDYALQYVRETATEGDPESVLRALEAFHQRWSLLQVGPEKGLHLDTALREAAAAAVLSQEGRNTFHVLEVGTYIGYSTIRMAAVWQRSEVAIPRLEILTCEPNADNARCALQLLRFAGVAADVVHCDSINDDDPGCRGSDAVDEGVVSARRFGLDFGHKDTKDHRVKVVLHVGTIHEIDFCKYHEACIAHSAGGPAVNRLPSSTSRHLQFEFVFFDHQKSLYKKDLLWLQEQGRVCEGGPAPTLIVADNVAGREHMRQRELQIARGKRKSKCHCKRKGCDYLQHVVKHHDTSLHLPEEVDAAPDPAEAAAAESKIKNKKKKAVTDGIAITRLVRGLPTDLGAEVLACCAADDVVVEDDA